MLSVIQERKRRSPAVYRSLSPQEKSEKGLLWFIDTKVCMGIIMHKFTKKVVSADQNFYGSRFDWSVILSIRQSKHMRVTRFNPLRVSV